MKRNLLLFILIFNIASLKAQDSLQSPHFHFHFRNDVASNLTKPGIKNAPNNIQTLLTSPRPFSCYLGEADLAAKFKSDDLKLWKNGTLFVQAMSTFGQAPSGNYLYDAQTFSNIEAEKHIALYEAWYEQVIKEKLTIRVGQLDMNADFMVNDYTSGFINSSHGVLPTASANMPLSIFPLLAPGAFIKYDFNSRLEMQASVYKADPGDFTSNPYGVNWKKCFENKHSLYMYEATYKFLSKDSVYTGKASFGIGLEETDMFTWKNESFKAKDFYYLSISKLVIPSKTNNENGLGIFAVGSIAPYKKVFASKYYSFGISFNGFKRKESAVSIGFLSLSPDARFNESNINYINLGDSYENVIEFIGNYRINKYLSIQPDVQYIIQPGMNKYYKNTLIGLLRVIIELQNLDKE
ncbi:MAG: carbohydrate porin [Bacteroidota bacterium]